MRLSHAIRGRIVITGMTLLVGMFGLVDAQQLPPANQPKWFGYFKADGRDGDFKEAVRYYTNLYLADNCAYDTFLYMCPAPTPFNQSLQAAVAEGQKIYLLLSSPNDFTVNSALDSAAPYWSSVALVEAVHEHLSAAPTQAATESRIAHVKDLITLHGLAQKPIGILIGMADALNETGVFATNADWVAVEAYRPASGSTGDAAALDADLAAAKSRIPSSKNLVFVTQAYTYDGAYTNTTELIKIQDVPYLRAFNDQRVIGLLLFAYGPPNATKDRLDLKVRHVKQAEGIFPSGFNADYHPDLVWRNISTGDNALWLLNGPALGSFSPTATPPFTSLSTDWQARAVGDINGDHVADVIWQHAQSPGEVAAWLFTGPYTAPGGVYVSNNEPDLQWKIVSAADMDRDGRIDLVWQHQTTGAIRIWHMNGTTRRDSVALHDVHGNDPSPQDPQWAVAAVADMDGDSWPDLVFRHTGTGALACWRMQDSLLVVTNVLNPGSVTDTNWKIAGVADIANGGVRDGMPDLLWQNTSTGQVAVWYMTWDAPNAQAKLTTSSYLGNTPVTDTNWRIVGAK